MSTPAPQARVPSPCINVCRMNPRTGWCEGCLRTLDEIAAWSTLDDAGRRAVWCALPGRQARLVAAAVPGVAAVPGADETELAGRKEPADQKHPAGQGSPP